MAKKIIFEGAAVSDDTREFFLKMAKIAFDDNLNVTLTERPDQGGVSSMYDNRSEFVPGSLVLVIWREEDITLSSGKNPST